jgi:hypothetical protein
MSVLLDEPEEHLDAMFEVRELRRMQREAGPDSQLME